MDAVWIFWRRHRNFLLVVIGLPTVVAATLSALLPRQYLSTTTAIPSNARLTDANRLVSNDARELYPVFGASDDLDRIYEISQSNTVAKLLVERFQLVQHYGGNPDRPDDLVKTLKRSQRNTGLLKTETGELKVSVWDRDPAVAAAMANAYLYLTDSIQRQLVASLHGAVLKDLAITSPPDSLRSSISDIDPVTLSAAANRILLAQRTVTPALLVIDPATPAVKPDRPNLVFNTLVTLAVSAFTAIAALLLFSPSGKSEA
jgi:uncharacterized protein involved in exopolysaccharide biosynthesis